MSDPIASHLAEALDPVHLARRVGWEPDAWQADALRTDAQWVALNCSRQAGKSQVASTKAVHKAVYQPGSLVVMIAPSQRQSQELFRRAMVVYKSMGRPVSAELANLSRIELENGSRLLAVPGDPDTVRGLAGVDLLVVDEAARVSDELYTAVLPMVGASNGQVLALSTPAGQRGWWWKACTDPVQQWEVVTVPAVRSRVSPEVLEHARRTMTDQEFRSEYLCEFIVGAGALFDADDINRAFTGDFDLLEPNTAPNLRLVGREAS